MRGLAGARETPRRAPLLTGLVGALLAAATVAALLAATGRLPLGPRDRPAGGRVYYVVAYHYGFAFYDERFRERTTIEARVGETVTLHVVPAHALPRAVVLAYADRSLARAIGGVPPGDPRIRAKIEEDLALGNVEHIVGIAAHPVYVATSVAALLDGRPFREDGPATLAEAARRHDAAIRSVTFTVKRVGRFDVLCIDSGTDGAGTCGWGHKWMVAKDALVVEP
jgi:hypothetical protein